MKVLHACLSNFYIDGFAYQENELVRTHVEAGHDVVVVASTETFDEQRRLTWVEPAEYVGTDGARVIRIPYRRWLPHRVARKVRSYPHVAAILEREAPDVVFFHSVAAWELRTFATYQRAHPESVLNVDSHEDSINSARTPASRLFHRRFYGPIVRSALDVISPVLCVTIQTMDFVHETYGVPRADLEFFPIGGRALDDDEYARRRDTTRAQYGVDEDDVLLLQAGKMTAAKRLGDTLEALADVASPHLRLLLAGSIGDDVADQVSGMIAADERVSFVGWKQPDELVDLLCAADVYVQPGTQSATMQMSLCVRCAVIIEDSPSHRFYVNGNGWLVTGRDDLRASIAEIAAAPERLPEMAARSLEFARAKLDYRQLAERALQRGPQPADAGRW